MRRRWGGVVAVAVACSLPATSARAATPAAQLARDSAAGRLLQADSSPPLAQLEARAAELSREYRGQLETLGIMYIIYRQRIWDVRMASSGWVPMEDRGSITANHYDHVHISVF